MHRSALQWKPLKRTCKSFGFFGSFSGATVFPAPAGAPAKVGVGQKLPYRKKMIGSTEVPSNGQSANVISWGFEMSGRLSGYLHCTMVTFRWLAPSLTHSSGTGDRFDGTCLVTTRFGDPERFHDLWLTAPVSPFIAFHQSSLLVNALDVNCLSSWYRIIIQCFFTLVFILQQQHTTTYNNYNNYNCLKKDGSRIQETNHLFSF